MATSGTTNFNLNLLEIVDEAYERCGKFDGARSGYDLKTARRSMNLMMLDWANRGINLWTLEEGAVPLVSGDYQYDLPTDTVDLLDFSIRNGSGQGQTDLAISRISASTYSAMPNKLMTGRPLQIMITRGVSKPSITVWPVPDNDTYTLVYWRLRRIQDSVGADNPDMPFRFLPCVVAGLAYYLAMKVPGAEQRIEILKAQYDEAWDLASSEDRDRSSAYFLPRAYR